MSTNPDYHAPKAEPIDIWMEGNSFHPDGEVEHYQEKDSVWGLLIHGWDENRGNGAIGIHFHKGSTYVNFIYTD